MDLSGLQLEWQILQNQFDSYEKYSLIIKLTSIFIVAGATSMARINLLFLVILALLWLVDGIWKTFQARIEARLIKVESLIANNSTEAACQFNSEFAQNRLSGANLIKEYIRQSLRPTVAIVYMVLLGLVVVNLFDLL